MRLAQKSHLSLKIISGVNRERRKKEEFAVGSATKEDLNISLSDLSFTPLPLFTYRKMLIWIWSTNVEFSFHSSGLFPTARMKWKAWEKLWCLFGEVVRMDRQASPNQLSRRMVGWKWHETFHAHTCSICFREKYHWQCYNTTHVLHSFSPHELSPKQSCALFRWHFSSRCWCFFCLLRFNSSICSRHVNCNVQFHILFSSALLVMLLGCAVVFSFAFIVFCFFFIASINSNDISLSYYVANDSHRRIHFYLFNAWLR